MMRGWFLSALFALGAFCLLAQEGHPLTGTWHGDWRPDEVQRYPIVIAMKWNNTEVEATLNPGRNGVPAKVTLDPAKWMVHIEADTKTGEHIIADGKMEDIGSYNRTITGAWSQGKAKGAFTLRRD